jgi:hypothetical protein
MSVNGTLKLTCRGRLQQRDAARNQNGGLGQLQRESLGLIEAFPDDPCQVDEQPVTLSAV